MRPPSIASLTRDPPLASVMRIQEGERREGGVDEYDRVVLHLVDGVDQDRGQELIDCLAQLSRLLSLLPLSDNEVEDVVEGDRIQRESCPRIREPLCHSQGFILSREDLGLPISPEGPLSTKGDRVVSSLGSTKLNPYFISLPELLQRPDREESSVSENPNPARDLFGFLKIMGGEENKPLPPQIEQQIPQLSPRYWVEACRGLV